MKQIPLTGKRRGVALVDDEDYDQLVRFKWNHISTGYARNNGKKWKVLMHRLLLGFPQFPHEVDHINGDRLDNRKVNLRECTRRENSTNKKTITNPTGFGRNVCHGGVGKKKYLVQSWYMGRSARAGFFDGLEEANAAAIALRIKLGYSDPYDLG